MSILESLRPAAHLRVLVTAGAGGIGAVTARALHMAGARVHVCDVDRAALDRLAAECRGITGSMADVSIAAEVAQVFDDVQGTLGGLDVLVSIAGITGPGGPIEGIGSAGWERTVAVNMHGQYHVARCAVPLLKQAAGGASLIAVGAAAAGPGERLPTPGASTRWAVVGLVKSLAVELGPHGVRVNAILPGRDDGPRPRGAGAVRAADVAAMVLFLCSPAARHVTGQTIGIDSDLAEP
jgi:NAD(P)-dependent dehydrogenase (short-subunit alcohol dehydrogenase family)